jgi:hypothetical protein
MPKRRLGETNGWYQIIALLLSLTLAISSAQRSVRGESQESEGLEGDECESRRSRMREFRQRIIASTGSTIWDGVEEDGIELPLFGVPHVGNRRNLNSAVSETKFSPEEIDLGLNSIGTRVAKNGQKKGNNKANNGAGGKGRRPPPRPTPPPRHPNPKPPSKTSSSKSGKGKGGKGRPVPRPTSPPRPTPRPPTHPPPPRPPTPRPTPNPPSGGCTTEIKVDFLQLSAIPPALFVNPIDPDEQTLGTRYVYNDGLRDQDTLDELVGSKLSGTCTRTQARVGDTSVGLQLGGGHCQFTYVLKDSRDREISFTASGEVMDSLGGVLSITGGSQSSVGAYGEIELLPVNVASDGQFEIEPGDFFLDPLFYLADARILVPCADQ